MDLIINTQHAPELIFSHTRSLQFSLGVDPFHHIIERTLNLVKRLFCKVGINRGRADAVMP